MISCYISTPIVASHIIHLVSRVTSTPTSPLSISVSPSPDYVMDILTAAYVALTLIIAVVAICSVRIGRKQSQAALKVAHEQIEQSKQPILIPLSALPLTMEGELDYTNSEQPLEFMNVGTGVALNIWGVLVPPKDIPRKPYSFSNQAHILQSKKVEVFFHIGQFLFFTESDKLFTEDDKPSEYDLWPSSELTQVGITNRRRYAARLTLTYRDVFGIKHATIYDHTNVNEWKIVDHFRVRRDLDDMSKDIKPDWVSPTS